MNTLPEGWPRHQQPPNAKDGHCKEVHDQHGGAGTQAGQQRDGPLRIPASQAEIVEARLLHLLVRCVTRVAEHLGMQTV